jgi:hypothetical protein
MSTIRMWVSHDKHKLPVLQSSPLRVVTVRSRGSSGSLAAGVCRTGTCPGTGTHAMGCRGWNGTMASADGARPAFTSATYAPVAR